MVTNGLALDADCLRSLMDAGLRSISISFDGFEDAHNYIRRNPRSFGKALDAIRLIVREPRLTYDVITCVTSPMVARLGEFKELLIAEGSSTGVFSRSSPSAGPRTIRRSRLPTHSSARCWSS